jgi:peptide/nickel transport system substrate-binding protein
MVGGPVRVAGVTRGGMVRVRRRFSVVSLLWLVVLALVVAACGAGSAGDGADDTSGSSSGGDELVIAVPELGNENWAIHRASEGEQHVMYLVHDELIEVDFETRERVAGLAETWEPNEDFTEWTFTLRDDVPFHPGPDGQDYGNVRAQDVKFSFSQYLKDDSVFSRSDVYRELIGGDLDNFEIVDDHTFRLHLASPNATVPSLFSGAGVTLVVTSEAYWEDVGEEVASAHPIGSGPFMFESHEPGSSVHMTAVEDHWRKTPGFSELELRIIPDQAAQLAQIRAGEVDLAPIALDLVAQAEEDGLRIISVPNVGVSSLYLGGHYPPDNVDPEAPWIQADNPEQGLAVRKAISHAIDREGIANDLLGGEATPVVGPLTYVPGFGATDPEWVGDGAQVPEYDPELARQLLAEGGYPDGFEIEQTSYDHTDYPFSVDISDAVESMLSDIGITVNHRRIPKADHNEYRETRSPDAPFYQYIQGFNDEPADRLGKFLPIGGTAEFNYEPYDGIDTCPSDNVCSGSMTEWIERMQTEPDYDERLNIAREIGQEMIDYVGPAIGIVSVNTQWVVGDSVGEWERINGVPWLHNVEYIEPTN